MLNQQAVTHDPRAGLTPSQLRAFDETLARRARLAFAPAGRARRPAPAPVEEPLVFKEPWFSIVCEIEGPLRIETIQKVVLARFPKVTRSDMLSARRSKAVVLPRHIAMYLAKELTPKSLPEIGAGFGGRDHTTILSAIRKIERLKAADVSLSSDIDAMSKILLPRGAE